MVVRDCRTLLANVFNAFTFSNRISAIGCSPRLSFSAGTFLSSSLETKPQRASGAQSCPDSTDIGIVANPKNSNNGKMQFAHLLANPTLDDKVRKRGATHWTRCSTTEYPINKTIHLLLVLSTLDSTKLIFSFDNLSVVHKRDHSMPCRLILTILKRLDVAPHHVGKLFSLFRR